MATRGSQGLPGLNVTLLGIPVRFELSYVIILLLIRRSTDPTELASWFVCGTFALLVHEFGHALLVRAFGRAPVVALRGFGGVTMWQPNPPLHPGKHLLVSLAGPAAGITQGALTIVFFRLMPAGTPLLKLVRHDLLWVSLGWSVFNLLPVQPLDGGNALHDLVQWLSGKRWPRAASAGSAAIWGLLAVWAFRFDPYLAYFGGYMAYGQLTTFNQKAGTEHPLIGPVRELVRAQRYDEAFAALAELRKPPAAPGLVRLAVELELPLALNLGDVERALAVVLELPPEVRLSPSLCVNLLVHAGRAELALARAEALAAPAVGAQRGGKGDPTLELHARSRVDLDGAIDSALRGGVHLAAPRVLAALGWRAADHGRIDDGRTLLAAAVHREPTAQGRFALALFDASYGRLDSARAELLKALSSGFADRRRILAEPALDPVRAHAEVVAAMERLPLPPVPPNSRAPGVPRRRVAERWPAALPALPPLGGGLAELRLMPPLLPCERRLAIVDGSVAQGVARTGPVVVRILRAAPLDGGSSVVEVEGLGRIDGPPDEPLSTAEREAIGAAVGAVVEQTPEADPRAATRCASVEGAGVLADLVGASLPLRDAERVELLAATSPRPRLEVARRLLQDRAAALAELPETRCPQCAYSPPPGMRWVCSHCSARWNTFATRGVCPGCGHGYQATACPACHTWSRHGGWYLTAPAKQTG